MIKRNVENRQINIPKRVEMSINITFTNDDTDRDVSSSRPTEILKYLVKS